MAPVRLDLIAAADRNMGIGRAGLLPWSLPSEFAYFTAMTTTTLAPGRRNAVVVGRRTWDTMDALVAKPFPEAALNVVLTRDAAAVATPPPERTVFCASIDDAVARLAAEADLERSWVLGGAQVYRAALLSPHFHRLYLTRVHHAYVCDAFFPDVFDEDAFVKLGYDEVDDARVPQGVQTDPTTGVQFEVCVYVKKQ